MIFLEKQNYHGQHGKKRNEYRLGFTDPAVPEINTPTAP